ncbi:substrate-binding domain-containing protein [Mycobacterium sp. 155]|uniref:substrate-binding domain-containing protein n=1 Tax=Mycobacterium sp. 155 TaxID=1157943 RepID=UPI0003601499|nr:substrate-binding domain-containing protein [Mycobacterium sp. 155]
MGRHSIPGPDDSADEPEHQSGRYDSAGHDPDDHDDPGHESDDYEDPDEDSEHDDTGYEDYDEDYVDRGAPTAQFSAVGPRQPGGRQHGGDWDGGEWTGSHRAVTTGRRGVSVGVIVALVGIVAVVAVVILWRFFGDALSSRKEAAAARCVDGDLAVAVIADPTISPTVQTLAGKYNDSANPIGDHCVKVQVKSAESDQVLNGFANAWPGDLGDRPALWIPASGVSEARLEATAGAKTVSDSRSLVTSPVLLAVPPQLKDALAQQNWSTLPDLQSNPTALADLKLNGWGPLKLALPTRNNGDTAYLAGEAVAAAAAPSGSPASAGLDAVNTLIGGQPKLDNGELGTAFDALLNASDPASAPVHAVATTEQQLFQRAASLSDAKSDLAGWLPPGPTALADYPTVLLDGDWLSQEQVTAASEFARFMRKPEQLDEFAKAGFRAEGATAPSSDVTQFAPVNAPLSVGDDTMRVTLANSMATPSKSQAVTIMLDQSMPTQEGGKSRLANVAAALDSRLNALPSTSEVGLWTFDGAEGRSAVSRGPLSDQVGGEPRSQALSSTLDEQTASGGGAVSFTTLRLIYTNATSNFLDGKDNSILVITTGPHTDQSLGGQGLQDYIRGAFDPAHPVAVNVIDFGGDTDRATWEAVARTTGGKYQHLTDSASPELVAAVATMLS